MSLLHQESGEDNRRCRARRRVHQGKQPPGLGQLDRGRAGEPHRRFLCVDRAEAARHQRRDRPGVGSSAARRRPRDSTPTALRWPRRASTRCWSSRMSSCKTRAKIRSFCRIFWPMPLWETAFFPSPRETRLSTRRSFSPIRSWPRCTPPLCRRAPRSTPGRSWREPRSGPSG